MHSDWYAWDYLRANPQGLPHQKKGIIAFSVHDPFIEKIIFSKIPLTAWNGQKPKVHLGSEISLHWCAENFEMTSLFGNSDAHKILFAENLPASVSDYFLKLDSTLCDSLVVLVFFSKNDFWQNLKKHPSHTSIEIKAPEFWKYENLLEFLCSQFGVFLSFEIRDFIVSAVESSVANYIDAIKAIALAFPKDRERLQISDVREVILKNRFDDFRLLTLLGHRQLRDFYEELAFAPFDEGTLARFVNLWRGYLLKLADPREVEKKTRPSKHDKEILACSKLWKQGEIVDSLAQCAEIEYALRAQEHFKVQEIFKRSYLDVISLK